MATESAIIPEDQLTTVSDSSEMSDETGLEKNMAEKLTHVVQTRKELGGSEEILILLQAWAYEDWNDYDIMDQPGIVATYVENYSEKAYKLQSAFEIQVDFMEGKSMEEIEDSYFSNLVEKVDNSDEDFHEDDGEMFLPKSAVEDIVLLVE